MNWFQQNRWLGTFLIVSGICILLAGYFLFSAKSSSDVALARFNEVAAERSRLERLDPFPSETNYRKMKVHLENYSAALEKVKEELKTHVLPAPPGETGTTLAPNEFQSRLRQAMLTVSEKAHANRVKLPDNFALGFDEFTAALPNTVAAPLLGQELAQVELIMNILIDARVDAVSSLARTPLPEERGVAPTAGPSPAAGRKPGSPPSPSGAKMLERGVIDLTFASSPSAMRKVLNQIGSSHQQFYITRTLHVRNDKDKGPAREQSPQAGATPPPAAPAKPAANAALNFIVGNEHLETSARIELVRFTF
jgi:hypothetical protein